MAPERPPRRLLSLNEVEVAMTEAQLFDFLSSAMTNDPPLAAVLDRYPAPWEVAGASTSTFRVWCVIAGTLRTTSGKAAALRWARERGMPGAVLESWADSLERTRRHMRDVDEAMELMPDPDPGILDECFARGVAFQKNRFKELAARAEGGVLEGT